MNRLINNIIHSKAPLMLLSRTVLIGLVVFMGILRLRLIVISLKFPHAYTNRDILQEYLIAKALVSGINPYLYLNKLLQIFIGKFTYYPTPSPHPPFMVLMSTPLLLVRVDQLIGTWLVFELLCLALIASMLSILWKGWMDWKRAILLFFLLLAWYLVMIELYYGQLTILITTLLLAALLSLRKGRRIIAGVLIGLTVAIKMITWPLIIYLALKRDWRTLLASSLTALGLNLIALCVMGFGPFMDYYLRVPKVLTNIWHAAWYNYSLWSIGYRLFEGTGSAIMGNDLNAPPLFNSPGLASLFSAGLVALFFLLGMIWATKTKNVSTAFALLVCVIVAVSPFSWDHYYIMLIIPVVILLQILARKSFPTCQTLLFIILGAMLFLFNEHIHFFVEGLNGGKEVLQANGYHISFISSLLEWLPIVVLVILTLLIWRSGLNQKQDEKENYIADLRSS